MKHSVHVAVWGQRERTESRTTEKKWDMERRQKKLEHWVGWERRARGLALLLIACISASEGGGPAVCLLLGKCWGCTYESGGPLFYTARHLDPGFSTSVRLTFGTG